MMIRQLEPPDFEEWTRMRLALWPDYEREELERQGREQHAKPENMVFVATREHGGVRGFVEADIRSYAEGAETDRIGYIEGWYVDLNSRRQGVGAALIRAAEDWARSLGCSAMGSDTWRDNTTSRAAHRRLGYHEEEALVHFIKRL
jgi:aminoglycoside 6'-N-acetyltransferase I